MEKITNLLNTKKITCSFEVTPNLSEAELDNLTVDPTFFSITWHAKSHQNRDLEIPPLRLAKLLKIKNKNVLLHLTCDLLTKDYLDKLIVTLREQDIRNLLVMLGESYDREHSDFKSTKELIKYIRDETGDYFCVGVVGFPDCGDEKLKYLQDKVNTGADFIITQAFFESKNYNTFLGRCRSIGINVPIIPGVFYFETYKKLNTFINMCKIKVSQSILDNVKDQEQTDKTSSSVIIEEMIKSIVNESGVDYFHFFTLDKLDAVSKIIKQIKG